jgi:L-ribulose-5-phosphate 3-epimerase
MLIENSRRTFLKVLGVSAAGGLLPAINPLAVPAAAAEKSENPLRGRIKRGVMLQLVEEQLSVRDKFKLLQDLGFDGVEIRRPNNPDPKEVVAAREATGLPIHGVTNSTSPDIRGAIDLAKLYGAETVLLVPGRVDARTGYDENYQTTQKRIRDAIEYAEKQQIKLLVENLNLFNSFLLSPLEMARYLDELASPWVGAYFDVGNVVRCGWPEQWIRILNKRIGKIHLKGSSRAVADQEGLQKALKVEMGEGDCDWAAVRAALSEINYSGWATAEVSGGDRRRLAVIFRQMNEVLGI